jgi:hypothetical protein
MMNNETKYEDKMYRLFDIFTFGILIVFVGVEYMYSSDDKKDTYMNDRLVQFRDFLNDPYSVITVLIFLLAVYLIVYLLRLSMDENDSIAIVLIRNLTFILIAVMLIVDVFKYGFQINLVDIVMTNWFLPLFQGWFPTRKTLAPTPRAESFANHYQVSNIVNRPKDVASNTETFSIDGNTNQFSSFRVG